MATNPWLQSYQASPIYGRRPAVGPPPAASARPAGSQLLSVLPSALAAGASFVPGIGTVAAAGLGAIGEVARQRMAGEAFNLGRVGTEAGLSAIPGGLGLLAKGLRAARTVNVGAKGLQVVRDSQTGSKLAGALTEAQAAPVTRLSANLRQSVVNPVVKAGPFGAAQETQITRDANALLPVGSAAKKYAAMPGVMKSLDGNLQTALSTNTKTVSAQRVAGELKGKLSDAAKYPVDDAGFSKAADAHIKTLLASADKSGNLSAKAIADTRRAVADDAQGAFRKLAGSNPLTGRDEAALGAWKHLSDVLQKVAPDAKGIIKQQATLFDAAPGLAKNANAAVGIPILGVKSKTAERALQAGRDVAGKALESKSAAFTGGALGAAGKYGKSLAAQGIVRGVAGAGTAPPPAADQLPIDPLADPNADPTLADQNAPADTGSGSAFSPETLQALAIHDIQTTGGKNLDKIATLDKLFGSGSAKAPKPLSAEANKQAANARSGLDAIGQLTGMISKDPSLPVKALAPTALGKNLTGAGQYEAARQEIIDVLARLRTGAAISRQEEVRFKAQLPQAGDDQATVQAKLLRYQTLFTRILANQQAGSPDLESAIR